jgi:hypothetical protein
VAGCLLSVVVGGIEAPATASGDDDEMLISAAKAGSSSSPQLANKSPTCFRLSHLLCDSRKGNMVIKPYETLEIKIISNHIAVA